MEEKIGTLNEKMGSRETFRMPLEFKRYSHSGAPFFRLPSEFAEFFDVSLQYMLKIRVNEKWEKNLAKYRQYAKQAPRLVLLDNTITDSLQIGTKYFLQISPNK